VRIKNQLSKSLRILGHPLGRTEGNPKNLFPDTRKSRHHWILSGRRASPSVTHKTQLRDDRDRFFTPITFIHPYHAFRLLLIPE